MISRAHSTVFIHIPKAAGQSVEQAFLDDLGLSWEARNGLLLRANDDPSRGPPRLSHLTAEEYVALGHLSQSEWDAFFRFAVVRDPYSRAVSLYRHLGSHLSYSDWVATWLTDTIAAAPGQRARWFVRPQVEFLCDASGHLLVHDLLRFETLAVDFAQLTRTVGLRSHLLPRRNTTGNRPQPYIDARPTLMDRLSRRMRRPLFGSRTSQHDRWPDYYDGKTADRIATLYAGDFSAFGYPVALSH